MSVYQSNTGCRQEVSSTRLGRRNWRHARQISGVVACSVTNFGAGHSAVRSPGCDKVTKSNSTKSIKSNEYSTFVVGSFDVFATKSNASNCCRDVAADRSPGDRFGRSIVAGSSGRPARQANGL